MSRLIKKIIDNLYNYHHKLTTSHITLAQSKIIFRKYNKHILDSIDLAFTGLPLPQNYRLKVKDLLTEAFSKSIQDNISSGVVFAGFGEEELLPIVKALKIEGIVKKV